MNAAKNTNLKSIAILTFVSIMLFGIFYYLITDVSNSTDLKATKKEVIAVQAAAPALVAANEQVKGNAEQKSVFKDLANQKADVQPKTVLAGSTDQSTQSTVPATGSDTMFAAFVVSSLIMFTGIYLLITQSRDLALAKFERRIIKELD